MEKRDALQPQDDISMEQKDINCKDQFLRLRNIISRLRAPDGCPWDREQTHESLKASCIEESCEVLCGIDILNDTGDSYNLMEELGDLLLQIVLHSQIAEEEGLFTIDDVCRTVSDKMIRRHPHVFGTDVVNNSGEVLVKWEEIKKQEKVGRTSPDTYLPKAFEEGKAFIDKAKVRKGL